jgi:hypothetical protein
MLIVFDLQKKEMGEEIQKFEKKDMRYEMQCENADYFYYHTALLFKKATNDVTDRKFIYKLTNTACFFPSVLIYPNNMVDLKKKSCSIKRVFHLRMNTSRLDEY